MVGCEGAKAPERLLDCSGERLSRLDIHRVGRLPRLEPFGCGQAAITRMTSGARAVIATARSAVLNNRSSRRAARGETT